MTPIGNNNIIDLFITIIIFYNIINTLSTFNNIAIIIIISLFTVMFKMSIHYSNTFINVYIL